jgi:uncharacterized protein YndB with AHSA1/START domain
MRIFLAALAALFVTAAPARADVASASLSAFLISAETELAASPDQVWRNLTRIGRWWNGAHSYSGDAGAMRLDARAGGCWCERWSGGGVEHGRVVLVMAHEGVRTLRLNAALGPLQALGAQGVLTFTITPHATGAKLTMTYRVAGDPALDLAAMAPLVDGVMMEQYGRLIRLSTTGSPD